MCETNDSNTFINDKIYELLGKVIELIFNIIKRLEYDNHTKKVEIIRYNKPDIVLNKTLIENDSELNFVKFMRFISSPQPAVPSYTKLYIEFQYPLIEKAEIALYSDYTGLSQFTLDKSGLFATMNSFYPECINEPIFLLLTSSNSENGYWYAFNSSVDYNETKLYFVDYTNYKPVLFPINFIPIYYLKTQMPFIPQIFNIINFTANNNFGTAGYGLYDIEIDLDSEISIENKIQLIDPIKGVIDYSIFEKKGKYTMNSLGNNFSGNIFTLFVPFDNSNQNLGILYNLHCPSYFIGQESYFYKYTIPKVNITINNLDNIEFGTNKEILVNGDIIYPSCHDAGGNSCGYTF